MRILSVGRAFPRHYFDQDQLLAALRRHWETRHFNPERLDRLHKNVLVSGRHMALPLEEYEALGSWGEANDAWIRVAPEVGEAAIRDALERADLSAESVDFLMVTTVTGLAVPSLDALLMNRLGFRSDTKRLPLFGLGCVAGAAGVARVADYLRAFPDHVAVLLAVELCSLTVQKQDLSIPNLIATGLFGDGAAAVVLCGSSPKARGPGFRVVASRSVFYPDSERVMGWDISEDGFRIVLSAEVPEVVKRHLRSDVDAFLADNGLDRSSIRHWICHPGGPKVLGAMEESLELPPGALDLTWDSLRKVGNLSSASVLMVLRDTLDRLAENPPAEPGFALLLAMGPGFCSELVLLELESGGCHE